MKRQIRRTKLISEINITPFTDVVLVLLIIFMVTTPLILQSGIKVNLPRVKQAEVQEDISMLLTVDAEGNIYYNGVKYTFESIGQELTIKLTNKPDSVVVINGDKDVKYDYIIKLLDTARQAGATKYALSAELTKKMK